MYIPFNFFLPPYEHVERLFALFLFSDSIKRSFRYGAIKVYHCAVESGKSELFRTFRRNELNIARRHLYMS